MKWISIFILGFFIGMCFAMALIHHNYKEISEPAAKMSDKLAFCDVFAQKSLEMKQSQPKEGNITVRAMYLLNLTHYSRNYFLCVQEAYNFSESGFFN